MLKIFAFKQIGAVTLQIFRRVRRPSQIVQKTQIACDEIIFSIGFPDVRRIGGSIDTLLSVRPDVFRPAPCRAFDDWILRKFLPLVERRTAFRDAQAARPPQHPVGQIGRAVAVDETAAGKAAARLRFAWPDGIRMSFPINHIRTGDVPPSVAVVPFDKIHQMIAAAIPEGAVGIAWIAVAGYGKMIFWTQFISHQHSSQKEDITFTSLLAF